MQTCLLLGGVFLPNDIQYKCIQNCDLHFQMQIRDFFKNTLKKYFHLILLYISLLYFMLLYNTHLATCDARAF